MLNFIFSFPAELDRLLEDAPSPFTMQHAARISSIRKRVSSMNAVLRSIQRRVDNIDRMLSTASPPGIHFLLLTECSNLLHNPLVPLLMLVILYSFRRSFVITMHVPKD